MNITSLIPPQFRILAVLLLIIGVFSFGFAKGAEHVQAKFDSYVHAQQTQVYDFEKINKLSVDLLTTKYVDRTKVITEKKYVYIDSAKNKVPDNFVLSNGFVSLHNDAVATTSDHATTYSDASPSGVKANIGLSVIAENYSICNANKVQLESLQQFINDYNANVVIVNKKKHFWDRKK